MILLHHPEVELSRALLAALPEGCAVVDWTDAARREAYLAGGGPSPTAFPTVLAEVPGYADDRPEFGEGGEFLGMAEVAVPAHQASLRLPRSWAAVDSYLAAVRRRARLRPVA